MEPLTQGPGSSAGAKRQAPGVLPGPAPHAPPQSGARWVLPFVGYRDRERWNCALRPPGRCSPEHAHAVPEARQRDGRRPRLRCPVQALGAVVQGGSQTRSRARAAQQQLRALEQVLQLGSVEIGRSPRRAYPWHPFALVAAGKPRAGVHGSRCVTAAVRPSD